MNLPETHPLAAAWTALVTEAATDLLEDAEPWRLHEFGQAPLQLSTIPNLLGPKIYAVPEGLTWFYVGQTRQPLRERLAAHLRRPERRHQWPAVMVLVLRDDISASRLDQLENIGRVILRPRMGSRWPARA